MTDERKTKVQLVRELRAVRTKLKKLEKSEEKRKRSEDALQESEERYRRLVEGSPDAVAMLAHAIRSIGECVSITDSDNKILFVNDAFLRTYGYAADELIGKPIAVVRSPRSGPSIEKVLSATLEGGWRGELVNRKKDGTEFPIALSTSVVRNEKGQSIALVGISADITERKQREEEQAYEIRLHKFRSEIAYAINRPLSLREILQHSAEAITRNLDVACAFIWTTNRDTNTLELQAYAEVGPPSTDSDECTRMGNLLASKAVAEGRLIACNSIVEGSSLIDASWARQNNIIAYAGLPLLVEDRIIGVLTVFARALLLEPTLSPLVGSSVTLAQGIMRKRAGAALHTSEAQLSNALKIAHLGHWEYDVAGDLFTFNDHFYAMLRTTAGQVGGYAMSSALYAQRFVHPDDMALVGVEIRKALETPDSHYSSQVDHRIIYGDGETGYITVRIFVIKDDQGRTIKTYGVNQDITERKRAEGALRESEERHRSLFENMLEGYAHCKMLFDNDVPRDFIYLDVNKAFGELTGLKDVVGKKASDVIRGITDSDSELINICGSVARTGKPKKFETYLKSLESWFSVAVYSPRREYFVAIFDNITERKQTDELLKKEHSLLSTIIEAIPDQICLKDTDSRYLLANKASVEALGAKSLTEMIGKTDLEYVRRDLALRLLAEEKEILESGKPSIGREMVRRDPKTGDISKCDLYTKLPIKDPEGKVIGLLVVNVDITPRKHADEKVRKSEMRLRQLAAHMESIREEERKRISQEFHDQLGQTLTALKMDLSLLERNLADEKKEISRTTIIEEIHSSQALIDRGIQTVRAIMSELRPELLDQLGFVEALEWEVGKFQQRSGVLCGLTADVGDLQFDARRSIALFRLVQEALTNVARHAQATRVDVIMRTEGNDLILEIKDDGIGITFGAENKPRSFGLIGMRERANFLGGNLEITGTMGKGTTIVVRMPIYETLPDGGGAI